MGVQRQSKHEYVARMQGRYLKASKREKGRLLDEVVEVTGYPRRHALRVLRHGRFPDPKLAAVQGLAPGGDGGRPRQGGGRPPGRPRVYSSVVVGARRTTAEAPRRAGRVGRVGRRPEHPQSRLPGGGVGGEPLQGHRRPGLAAPPRAGEVGRDPTSHTARPRSEPAP